MTRENRNIDIFNLIQVVLIIGIPIIGVETILNWWVHWLIDLPDPHAVIKMLLESSQGMLLRQNEILWSSTLLASMMGIATLLPRVYRNGFIAFVAAIMWLLYPFYNWAVSPLIAILLLCWTIDQRSFSWLRWVPIVGLHLPHISLSHRSLRLRAIWITILTFSWQVGIVWLDCLTSYDEVRERMEEWPEDLLDSRIQVLAQNPNVRADWHGVIIEQDYAVVVAESTMRLMAFPLNSKEKPFVYSLGDRWGPERAAPLNVVYDANSSIYWTIGSSKHLNGFKLNDNGWTKERTIDLPTPINYAYLQMSDERWILLPVQVKRDFQPPLFALTGEYSNWSNVQHIFASGTPISYPREFTFIPEQNIVILAPDFGTHLFIFDLKTGDVNPLIETPTLDGKMRWVPELNRLFVALPNRLSIWVIDIEKGEVDWVIPTQPGVRSLAIDFKRNIIVNASVITGQILVQDLYTGEILDRLGTVMPMVREIALQEYSGQAVLTTWAAVYQFPYTGERL